MLVTRRANAQHALAASKTNTVHFGCLGMQLSCAYDHFGPEPEIDFADAARGTSRAGWTPALPAAENLYIGGGRSSPSRSCPSSKARRGVVEQCLANGRIFDAVRELDQRPDDGTDVNGCESLVRRMASYFERDASASSTVPEAEGDGWYTERVDEFLTYSYLMKDGVFEIRCSTTSKLADVAQVVAAICEVDLQKNYRPNLVSATPFGATSWPISSNWHLLSRGRLTGGMEDVILQVCGIDALDEAAARGGGCVWVTLRTPEGPEECTEAPLCEPGVMRLTYTSTTLRVEPLGERSSGCEGVALTLSIRAKPSPLAAMALSNMPAFVVRKLVRSRAQESIERFRQHAESCKELHARMENSPRTPFYEAIRCHVRGEKTKFDASSSETSTTTSMSTSLLLTKRDVWQSPSTSWADLSIVLPVNWADGADSVVVGFVGG